MSYKIKLLPEARLDIKESIEWYNDQKAGLGKRFYESVKSRLQYIRKNPLHFDFFAMLICYESIRSKYTAWDSEGSDLLRKNS
jgi:hypothetical protein